MTAPTEERVVSVTDAVFDMLDGGFPPAIDPDESVSVDGDGDGEALEEERWPACSSEFWGSASSEAQLRDRLAGVLMERGWSVLTECDVWSGWGRMDLLLIRPDEIGGGSVILEVKMTLRTARELRLAITQAAGYATIRRHGWPDEPCYAFVLAGGLMVRSPVWEEAFGLTVTTAEEFVTVIEPKLRAGSDGS